MIHTHYFIAPIEDVGLLQETCNAHGIESQYHSIADDHNTVLFLVICPKTSFYLECQSKYLSFPELRDKRETISKELVQAFPASVGLTEQDSTFSALKKINTVLGMAAMHPHR